MSIILTWKTQLTSLTSQDTAISSLGTLLSNLSNDVRSRMGWGAHTSTADLSRAWTNSVMPKARPSEVEGGSLFVLDPLKTKEIEFANSIPFGRKKPRSAVPPSTPALKRRRRSRLSGRRSRSAVAWCPQMPISSGSDLTPKRNALLLLRSRAGNHTPLPACGRAGGPMTASRWKPSPF